MSDGSSDMRSQPDRTAPTDEDFVRDIRMAMEVLRKAVHNAQRRGLKVSVDAVAYLRDEDLTTKDCVKVTREY